MILFGSALTAAVCAYAVWRGDTPARRAAILVLAVMAGSLAGQTLLGWSSAWPVLAADLCLGFGLITIAAIHSRRWLYIEVGLCAGLLLTHSFLLDADAIVTPVYRACVDTLNVAMLVVFVTGALRRR